MNWIQKLFGKEQPYKCRNCPFASDDLAEARVHDAGGHQVLMWNASTYRVLSEYKGA